MEGVIPDILHLGFHYGAQLAGPDGPIGAGVAVVAHPLDADLHLETRLPDPPNHLLGFGNGVGHGLFAIDVLSRIQCVQGLPVVPVLRRGDDDVIHVLHLQQVPMVDLLHGASTGLRDSILELPGPGPVHVRHGHDLDVGALGHLQQLGQVVAAGDLSAADDSDAEPMIGPQDPSVASSRESGSGQPGSAEKSSSIEL